MTKKRRICLEKTDLLYLAACWNSDPYLLETDEQIDEIWSEVSKYGYHVIKDGTDDYQIACAQLDLDVNAHYPIFETDNFTCKFGGLLY